MVQLGFTMIHFLFPFTLVPGNIGLSTSPSYGHHQLEKKEHRRGGKGRRKDKKHKGNGVYLFLGSGKKSYFLPTLLKSLFIYSKM